MQIDGQALEKTVTAMKEYRGDELTETRIRQIIEDCLSQDDPRYDPLAETSQDVWSAYKRFARIS